jgi:hypothetical protein
MRGAGLKDCDAQVVPPIDNVLACPLRGRGRCGMVSLFGLPAVLLEVSVLVSRTHCRILHLT